MNLKEYQEMQPHAAAHGLVWLTPNEHCAWRVSTLMTKEPDTIAWINGMKEGDVLYDVGANMGQYAMLAAKRGVKVHAFEPESQNFALMVRNIAINKLGHLITPWPMALSYVNAMDIFYVTSLMPGGSCNSFGESVDYHLKPKEFQVKQGCFGATLDHFASQFEPPTYIKLDVDGFEHKVLYGADHMLETVRSVLVETNTHLEEHMQIALHMAKHALYPDTVTADEARRTEGPFEGVGNVIYCRYAEDFPSVKAMQALAEGEA